jgi:hypothetical protein
VRSFDLCSAFQPGIRPFELGLGRSTSARDFNQPFAGSADLAFGRLTSCRVRRPGVWSFDRLLHLGIGSSTSRSVLRPGDWPFDLFPGLWTCRLVVQPHAGSVDLPFGCSASRRVRRPAVWLFSLTPGPSTCRLVVTPGPSTCCLVVRPFAGPFDLAIGHSTSFQVCGPGFWSPNLSSGLSTCRLVVRRVFRPVVWALDRSPGHSTCRLVAMPFARSFDLFLGP